MRAYIYLAGRHAVFPAVVGRYVRVVELVRHIFEGVCSDGSEGLSDPVVVFAVTFSALQSEDALSKIVAACGRTRVVCARRPIFVGVTATNTLLWSVQLGTSKDVVFSDKNDADVWEAADPQPVFARTLRRPVVKGVGDGESGGGEMEVDVECDAPYLVEGDHIAYFLPGMPVEEQMRFVVTKVVGFQPSQPCFVQLENGHHTTIVASGNVVVGKYCTHTHRVAFPLRNLAEFRINV